jgi:hypothetical protein
MSTPLQRQSSHRYCSGGARDHARAERVLVSRVGRRSDVTQRCADEAELRRLLTAVA